MHEILCGIEVYVGIPRTGTVFANEIPFGPYLEEVATMRLNDFAIVVYPFNAILNGDELSTKMRCLQGEEGNEEESEMFHKKRIKIDE